MHELSHAMFVFINVFHTFVNVCAVHDEAVHMFL